MGCNSSKTTVHVKEYSYNTRIIIDKRVIKRKKKKKEVKKDRYEAPLLYIWPPSAPCRAVLMAAKAADIKIKVKNVDLTVDEHKNKDFVKVNPEGKVPTLATKDFNLGDSHKILQHLIDEYVPDDLLYPRDHTTRGTIDVMLQFDNEKAYPAISDFVYPQVISDEAPKKTQHDDVIGILNHIEEALSMKDYISCEHLTIADFSVHSTITLLELVDWDFSRWEALRKWRNVIKELWYYSECNKGLEEWKFARIVKLEKLKEENNA